MMLMAMMLMTRLTRLKRVFQSHPSKRHIFQTPEKLRDPGEPVLEKLENPEGLTADLDCPIEAQRTETSSSVYRTCTLPSSILLSMVYRLNMSH